jgi:glycosyltransferase involved in cell wall biosynthesis
MKNKKISVITVCFNAEKQITNTIESISKNKLDNIEYIIIDGGSKDKTLQIIDTYKNQVDHFISEKDNGIYDAMNKGIQMASGDYITFLNADDYIDDLFFSNINKIILKFNPDYIYSSVVAIYNNGKKKTHIPKNIIDYKTPNKMPFPHPGLVVSKQIFQQIGLFDTKYKFAADLDWVLKMVLAKKYIGNFNSIPNIYYTMGGAGNSFKSLKESIEIYSKYNNSIIFKIKSYIIGYLKLLYIKIINEN